jgi:hypothetical protein
MNKVLPQKKDNEMGKKNDRSSLFHTFLFAFPFASITFHPNIDSLSLAFIQSFVQTKKNRDNIPTVRIPILRYTIFAPASPQFGYQLIYSRYELELHREELNCRETTKYLTPNPSYSTVTDLAKFRGLSTSQPR